jgi:DNA helicase-2/ATP-dependent DNA helicase PcrA
MPALVTTTTTTTAPTTPTTTAQTTTTTTTTIERILDELNPEQRRAASAGKAPLLIVAGAGTGKTTTLAHRVAHLIAHGTPPGRILMLTFSRRAAAEMLRRVDSLLRRLRGQPAGEGEARSVEIQRLWGGTFHAVATRLLRLHGEAIGLAPDFTILDRADSEDLLNVLRAELGLAKHDRRFPKKSTCLSIYSRCVNARAPLEAVVERAFPWCTNDTGDLRRLLSAYVDRKNEQGVLDYDDLLVFLHALLEEPRAGAAVRERFDCVLVDEYQDTNALQAEILSRLRPGGSGVTVVGDDAQAIYGFRAATVRNILDFPSRFPGAQVVTLVDNYRSTPPIVEATNRVIAQARERHEKELRSRRAGGGAPTLVTCRDEDEQTAFVVERILAHREEGTPLRKQAVLFRAAHHSMALELELSRRNIPFHKYGGLRFVEAAHVKDLVAFLRLADNPRDVMAGMRALLLLPGVGPAKARRLMEVSVVGEGRFEGWARLPAPSSDADAWRALCELMRALSSRDPGELPSQVQQVRRLWERIATERYDHVQARLADLDQLEQIAARYQERRAFLAELALDPPASTQELAGPPTLDDDYLILSTIHSAKGLEWDGVFVIHAADGNIPSDLATGRPEEIDEELRLFYVALTRARDHLYVTFPQRYYHRPSAGSVSDAHSYAQLTRFLPAEVRAAFGERAAGPESGREGDGPAAPAEASTTPAAIRERVRGLFGQAPGK